MRHAQREPSASRAVLCVGRHVACYGTPSLTTRVLRATRGGCCCAVGGGGCGCDGFARTRFAEEHGGTTFEEMEAEKKAKAQAAIDRAIAHKVRGRTLSIKFCCWLFCLVSPGSFVPGCYRTSSSTSIVAQQHAHECLTTRFVCCRRARTQWSCQSRAHPLTTVSVVDMGCVRHPHVHSHQADYYADSSSAWLNKKERTRAQQAAEARHKDMHTRKAGSVTIDLLGRRVVDHKEAAEGWERKQDSGVELDPLHDNLPKCVSMQLRHSITTPTTVVAQRVMT